MHIDEFWRKSLPSPWAFRPVFPDTLEFTTEQADLARQASEKTKKDGNYRLLSHRLNDRGQFNVVTSELWTRQAGPTMANIKLANPESMKEIQVGLAITHPDIDKLRKEDVEEAKKRSIKNSAFFSAREIWDVQTFRLDVWMLGVINSGIMALAIMDPTKLLRMSYEDFLLHKYYPAFKEGFSPSKPDGLFMLGLINVFKLRMLPDRSSFNFEDWNKNVMQNRGALYKGSLDKVDRIA